MPELHDPHVPTDSLEPEALPPLTRAATAPIRNQPDPRPEELGSVNIPLEDVTAKVQEVNQAADVAMQAEVQARVDAVLRSGSLPLAPNGQELPREVVQAHNERMKREFQEQVLEMRRQAAAPPPKPQPVPKGILDQTRKEMEAGAKQSAYWAEQQKLRPQPNERDRQAAGMNTPVFQPASYAHERGENFAGKEYTKTNLPGR